MNLTELLLCLNAEVNTLTVLDIILIPRFQQYGPPIADTIVFSVMSLVLLWEFNKKYKLIGRRNDEE